MTDKQELKQLLVELNQQGDLALARTKAAEFLKNVDAKTLSLAEQELMEEGVVSQEDLRNLCGIHLEVLGGGLEQQRVELETGHPVETLMAEHTVILQNLKELQKIVDRVQSASGFEDIGDALERLREISHLLLETESHHQREEEVLFPRLESQGVTGPPRIMRLEHEELRAKKRQLAELLKRVDSITFTEFTEELRNTGGYLAVTLGEHIYKEDHILYPTALQTLGVEEWSQVLDEFNRIGYCYFTPKTG